MSGLTQERLKEVLSYNADTGDFFWLINVSSRTRAGYLAGSLGGHGYPAIGIDGVLYLSHRLAWLYVFGFMPPEEIDHINHNRTDTRIVNLRLISRLENCRNMSLSATNTSGITGVSWHNKALKWRAYIKINYKHLHLGLFSNFNDAVIARKMAEWVHGFHKNHGEAL